MQSDLSRRGFLAGASAAGVALRASAADAGTPALLGGSPLRSQPFPAWPVSGEPEERALMDVLHSGKWFRGSGQYVKKFEQEYARMTGAKDCLATSNGTAALFVSLNVMGVEPGDEVLFSAPRLKQWEEKNRCPANDRLCSEAVWFTQNMLLAERPDMEQIAAAVRKIQAHAGELVKA